MHSLAPYLLILALLSLFLSGCDEDNIPGEVVPYTLGELQYAGNGCPQGSLEIIETQEGKNLSLKFEQFEIETGQKKLIRKACQIALPITFPKGLKLKLASSPILGSVDVSAGGKAYAKIEAFLAGEEGDFVKNDFLGPMTIDEGQLAESSHFTQKDCSGNGTIRLAISALAKSGHQGTPTYIKLNSLSDDKRNSLSLTFEKCQKD